MAFVAGVVAGIGLTVATVAGGASTIPVTAIMMVLFLAVAPTSALRMRLLTRIELASRRAVALSRAADDDLARGAVLTPDERAALIAQQTLAAGDLAVGFDRVRILRQQGLIFGLGAILEALAWAPGTGGAERAYLVFLGAMMIVPVALGAVRIARWGSRKRPVMRLDDRGLHMPRYRYTLPWAELAEVRLVPLRAIRRRGGQPIMIVAFVPADAEAAVRELRANGGGRRFEQSWRLHGTPLTIADRLMTQTAEQIAATASAFAALPVRRY